MSLLGLESPRDMMRRLVQPRGNAWRQALWPGMPMSSAPGAALTALNPRKRFCR
jgi:hypothetical protein